MNLRYFILTILAVLATSFGTVAAQHSTDHGDHSDGTPHAEHDDHGDHSHGMDNVSMGSFYFTVTNNGDEDDRLVAVETEMAEIVEIHNVVMDGGTMQMLPQHDGVEIAAGEQLVLEPGGYHIMLIGITESMLDGEDFTATLHFEHAGEVEITVRIHALEPDEDEHSDPVEAGDIEVSNIWARQAPKLDGVATPMATPDATPGT